MTEQKWLECGDPLKMLDIVRGNASNRKLRLFACAAARQLWQLLARDEWRGPADERSRRAVELAEAFIEGRVSTQHLREAVGPAQAAMNEVPVPYPMCGEAFPAIAAAGYAEAAVAEAMADAFADDTILCKLQPLHEDKQLNSSYPIASVLRCLFNPFRPVTLNPAWLAWNDGTIPKLAQGIYDDRAFDRLPILADALEESGCDNTEILSHCRGLGPHARGCWAVDLVLGKE